ncbi:hypothetical protein PCE1_002123 [Barthelona sp. PCE]
MNPREKLAIVLSIGVVLLCVIICISKRIFCTPNEEEISVSVIVGNRVVPLTTSPQKKRKLQKVRPNSQEIYAPIDYEKLDRIVGKGDINHLIRSDKSYFREPPVVIGAKEGNFRLFESILAMKPLFDIKCMATGQNLFHILAVVGKIESVMLLRREVPLPLIGKLLREKDNFGRKPFNVAKLHHPQYTGFLKLFRPEPTARKSPIINDTYNFSDSRSIPQLEPLNLDVNLDSMNPTNVHTIEFSEEIQSLYSPIGEHNEVLL